MAEAERLARADGLRRVAVISGVGTRRYYAKLGYRLEGDGLFMLKDLPFFAPGWREALSGLACRACELLALLLVLSVAALCLWWSCEGAACVRSVLL
mmetsp:Transcript_7894/g.20478  ORF Transcript_7894/g.20478 Transcript_7894/m.20478 type:complete len:97 (+) Transcript_7894:270-560(+)